ncbi:hypothetical protein XarbCFBP8150_21830 [Xanthomonas arboricola]|nr:hypothetical protein XarbCFBP8150_21830 [Xanthomonas arboricola]
MPRKSLHGRTCGVSRDGGRARALQRSTRSDALLSLLPQCLVCAQHNMLLSSAAVSTQQSLVVVR